jgi:photosystem II stability/assembly factor-like uncharacterized protein
MKKPSLSLLTLVLCLQLFTGKTQNQPWTNIGPVSFPKSVTTQIHGIGRVSQLKFHPSDANKMYAVSASGGLWQTSNKGLNWTNLGTDGITNTKSASFAIDPNNNNIMYWGTGDANFFALGKGVYKSVDGGKTWTIANTGMGNRVVIEILILPNNPQTIIAATNNGIYKSSNGGSNWTLKSGAISMYDLTFKPGSNGQILYAAAAKGFYRSLDAGETWTNIVSPSFINGGIGSRIATSSANPSMVYFANIGAKTAGEIYLSTDDGNTFQSRRTENVKLLGGYGGTSIGQGNYNFDIYADQVNPLKLYLCAQLIWMSSDGGATWTQQQNSWASNIHTDQHQILKNPYNNNELWNVNDGGVWNNYTDGTGAWNPMSNGMAISEIYHGSASNTNTSIGYIGTQDNGGFYFDAGDWTNNRGGDDTRNSYFDFFSNAAYYETNTSRTTYPGRINQALNLPFTPTNCIYAFTPSNKNIAYVVNANSIYRCNNLMSSTGLSWTFLFKTPNGIISDLQADPGNADLVYIVANNQLAYRSDNATTTAPTFVTLSLPSANNTESHILPISNSSIVYLSTNSTIFRSADKGNSWINVSSGFPASIIKGLVADQSSDKEAIYAAYTLGVYYKDKSQTNWTSYAAGLPIIAGITELYAYNDPSNALLRISTYGRGVWETKMIGAPLATPKQTNQITITDTIDIQTTNASILGTETNHNVEDQATEAHSTQISIYPNPSLSGNFNLKVINLKDKKLSYQITDNLGNVIQEDTKGVIDDKHYHTIIHTSLYAGIYYLRIKIEEQIISKKIEILSIPHAK